jgi:hypothetical protein
MEENKVSLKNQILLAISDRPSTYREVAKQLDCGLGSSSSYLSQLAKRNLVRHNGFARYEITDLGRAELQPVFHDEGWKTNENHFPKPILEIPPEKDEPDDTVNIVPKFLREENVYVVRFDGADHYLTFEGDLIGIKERND